MTTLRAVLEIDRGEGLIERIAEVEYERGTSILEFLREIKSEFTVELCRRTGEYTWNELELISRKAKIKQGKGK